jgi:hypothetical protein
MNLRTLHLLALATALGGAVGIASAQQAGMGAAPSAPPDGSPAAAKGALGVHGNAVLTSETALSGTPRQGKPGTQSGVAVRHTVSMGAAGSGAWAPSASSEAWVDLSVSQMRSLQRHHALR